MHAKTLIWHACTYDICMISKKDNCLTEIVGLNVTTRNSQCLITNTLVLSRGLFEINTLILFWKNHPNFYGTRTHMCKKSIGGHIPHLLKHILWTHACMYIENIIYNVFYSNNLIIWHKLVICFLFKVIY